MLLPNVFFKNFRINVITRFMAILILLILLVFSVFQTGLWSLAFWITLGVLFMIVEFIRYIERFKKNFLNFLDAVNQDDFSISFQEGRKEAQDEKMYSILNELNSKFRELRLEKESRHQYLNTVIDHINIGLISYNEMGEVTLINRAACELLNKPHIKRIESIKKISNVLYTKIINLDSEEKTVESIILNNELLHLSLQATELRLETGYQKVISMQNIKNELDEKELESWQKLVRVINHEIMNSVIPISTLANVLNHNLQADRDKNHYDISDIAEGLKVIEERSKGLASFVKATKSLTHLSRPVFKEIKIKGIFSRIDKLLNPGLVEDGIRLVFSMQNDQMMLKGDMELVEQVLINLIKNAREAYEGISRDKKLIIVTAETGQKQVILKVVDRGKGITEKNLDNIFIPFFTTRKEGSGIGLPLSRQIMRLHNGRITVHTQSGIGTEVDLVFQK